MLGILALTLSLFDHSLSQNSKHIDCRGRSGQRQSFGDVKKSVKSGRKIHRAPPQITAEALLLFVRLSSAARRSGRLIRERYPSCQDSLVDGGTISRRNVFSSVATCSLLSDRHLRAATLEEQGFLDNLLRESNIYAVKVDSTKRSLPSAKKQSLGRLLRTLESKQAIFLGEHHPALRDHLLQAALLRRLFTTRRPLAVGLEAVQRRFQPVLDDYIARRITEQQLFVATDWERRWYWSFEGYAPIFRFCREHSVQLLALDVDSEDKAKIEVGGLASLEYVKRLEYVPDVDGFEQFGRTHAFNEYVSYTLKPPYTLMKKLGRKMATSTNAQSSMTFANFLARQSLRDEAMAAISAAWLARNSGGMMLGLVGVNHVKFSCGVPARTARMLPGGLDKVTSILLNPTPANTFVDPLNLRVCDRTAVANEACVRNEIEVQNYVLQVPYVASQGLPQAEKRNDVDQDEAFRAMQAKKGSSMLAIADYMIFSPM